MASMVESAGFANDHERRQFVERVEKPVAAEFETEAEQRKAADDAETMEALFTRYTKAPYDQRSAIIERLLAVQIEDVKNR